MTQKVDRDKLIHAMARVILIMTGNEHLIPQLDREYDNDISQCLLAGGGEEKRLGTPTRP